MGLMDQIKQDVKEITSNKDSGFAVALTFTSRKDNTVSIINGLHTRINYDVDTMGNVTNHPQAFCSFSEELLTLAGYPVRSAGEMDIKGDKVKAKDSAGADRTYKITQTHPD